MRLPRTRCNGLCPADPELGRPWNGQAATIVRAVLGLGRGLGLPVLAEGVETDAELRFLRDEHCDAVQGYLLGRPAPIDTFRHFTHDEIVLNMDDFQRAPREVA
jgi:predicted signal transduction protein with EAL and GGDEF domain